MNLKTYMERNHLGVTEFARLVGCVPSAVSMWRLGHRIPDLRSAFAIERVTKGAVPAASWDSPPKKKTRTPRAA